MRLIALVLMGVLASCSGAQTKEGSQAGALAGITGECSRNWAKSNDPTQLRGFGLSGEKLVPQAREQAKAQAFKDLAEQIFAQVQSQSQLSETDVGSAFSSQTLVGSELKELTGAKTVLEGTNPVEGITSCVVIEYDLKAAEKASQGRMKVLAKKIEKAEAALGDENWGDFLKEARPAIQVLNNAHADIVRADALRLLLKAPGFSAYEKFEGARVSFENGIKTARERLAFVMPKVEGFEEAMEDARSRIRSMGFSVADSKMDGQAQGFLLHLKPAGVARKSQTSLGLTLTQFVGVIFSDLKTGRDIGSARGAAASGASPTGDEEVAQHNLQRQAALQMIEAVKKGIPGAFDEEK